MNLKIQTVVTEPFQENCYLIWQEEYPGTIIIDPGGSFSEICSKIKEYNLLPAAILNTHAHLDHVGAVALLKQTYDIPFYLHSEEKIILEHFSESRRLFGLPPEKEPVVDIWFNNESPLTVADFRFEIVPAPGHTPGSTCLKLGEHIFSGDTLFKGSIGRTDLPGGNSPQLQASLSSLMRNFSPDVIIHTGHGPDTTLGQEIRQNPFLIYINNKLN
ncbi:MAG: MBL fold metallo-hydrolase [Candidatus Neomarinimicrobiota bacterium]